MCGITGIFSFTEQGETWQPYLKDATHSLRKRGPDKEGLFFHKNVGLGHRRLSILDTSDAGSQPMTDPSGRYTLVFNGEIYNFPELKQQLLNRGISFLSHSDTEVLLHLYIWKGKDCLKELNGFFAFAIYDKEDNSVFVARDRIGIKPLVYYQNEHAFVFGSEIKALMKFPIKRELNTTALFQYLQFNYVSAPATMFQSVYKLMPGQYMVANAKGVTIETYYQIPFDEKNTQYSGISYKDQQKKLVELLDESVKKRLIADVPLGAFLSGGIDSSIITALATRHVDDFATFSIGFKDNPYFDETEYANLVAKKYGTRHNRYLLTQEDLFGSLHETLDYLDEPFADSSALLVQILSRETRKHMTVALSGDGADELFAGYHKYFGEMKARKAGLAAIGVRALSPLWKSLPKSRHSSFGNKIRQLDRFADGMKLDEKERYWRWCGFIDEKEAASMVTPGNSYDTGQYSTLKNSVTQYLHPGGSMNEFLYTDVQNVLPNDMLRKVDSMSMANSLEVRVPFLDHNVVEFAFQLPIDSKINNQLKKRILQDAFRDILPPELYNRPKQGFEVPLLAWFRTDLKSLITDDLLEDSFIKNQGIFDPMYITELKHRLFSHNPGDVHAQIWGLIVFQNWWKNYFL